MASRSELVQEDISRTITLCARCKTVNIEDAMKNPHQSSSSLLGFLGEIHSGLQTSQCPLCRLLFAVHIPVGSESKHSHRGPKGYQLRACAAYEVVGPISFKRTGRGAAHGVAFGVCGGSKSNVQLAERRKCLTHGFIAPLSSLEPGSQTHPFQVQRVCQELADFGQIRAWLQHCKENHVACKLEARTRPKGFVCIDVNHQGIITTPIHPNQEYLALSYVWAESYASECAENNRSEAQTPQKSDVPQVIRDAMTVAQELGIKYLWADKYCIDQESDHKQTQINAMDKIYEGATATIIAAPYKGSAPGLPGVSRFRKTKQAVERVENCWLASTLSHLSVVVAGSTWATRAWTYQEAVLSNRCLYFTDEQVHFLCRSGHACESITTLPVTDIPSFGLRDFRSYAFDTNFTAASPRTEGLWQFFENLHHYKNRVLSFDSDSLNAFQGILARSDFVSIWGIPVACYPQIDSRLDERDLAIGFARGLWWENPVQKSRSFATAEFEFVPYRRRSNFPSWSWAGWDGPTRLHEFQGEQSSDTGCNELDQSTFSVRFAVERESGDQISLAGAIEGGSLPLSHSLYIEALICKVRIRRPTDKNPLPYVCDCEFDRAVCKEHRETTTDVRLFVDPVESKYLSVDFFSRSYHVIHLFTVKERPNAFGSTVASIFVDWNEKFEFPAQVIGVAYLQDRLLQGGRRQRVRLI